MAHRYQAKLQVNNEQIDLNPFTEQFVARTVAGAVSSLRGADNIQSLELTLKQGNVTVIVNGKDIETTLFPSEIFASTVTGMVSPLRGVDQMDSLSINVTVT